MLLNNDTYIENISIGKDNTKWATGRLNQSDLVVAFTESWSVLIGR